MANWTDVAKTSDIKPGSWQVITLQNLSILIFNLEGNFYAVQNLCTHDGGPLAEGCLVDDEIVCPRHGARFCVRTGAVTQPPAYEDLPTFPVRVVEDVIQLFI